MEEPSLASATTASPEIEATIARLSGNKNVRGVLILTRQGTLLRSAGGLFSSTSLNEDGLTTAQAYADKCWRLVEGMGLVCKGEDEVKFARIRVRKLEWIITPGSSPSVALL
jgi:dynein light chain roadblock-type